MPAITREDDAEETVYQIAPARPARIQSTRVAPHCCTWQPGPARPAGNVRLVDDLTIEETHPGGAIARAMGITITEASPERVVGTMPVRGNTQPYGLLHGGASCVLAESLGSIGAAMHGARIGRPVSLGVDINATHHRAVRDGLVTGVATPLFAGHSAATYEVVITDESQRRVCTARLTCLLRAA
jgi:1,4-dihydroxy-2-naphthoyl-CoA hydrolase